MTVLGSSIGRRSLLKAAGATGLVLGAPAIVKAADQRVLKLIPQADLAVLDPIWTTAYVTRNHAFMVFDTLFGQDSRFKAQPQMVGGVLTDADGKLWKLTLRNGLRFHDGTPVLARDCVASINRWGKRDAFGQALLRATDELSAPDDKTIQFRLKQPFPLLPDALGKVGPNMCPIMPERLAQTDAFKQVTEMVGSGPFRFLANERVSGAHVAYERFAEYKPRESGTPEWTAGPKIVHFDRVEWQVIPDTATASSAIQRGEVDWWEKLDFDQIPLLKKDPNLQILTVETTGNIGILRMNQLFAPFDNPAIRRALMGAVNQTDFVSAVAGDNKDNIKTGIGFFTPDTPLANDTGMAALTGPRDLDKVKRDLAAAGYKGERIVVMVTSDFPALAALGNVGADMLQRCGMNVDLVTTDWGSVIQRRAVKSPPDKGGWNVFFTTFTGLDMTSPASNVALRGNGADSWFGWPTAPDMETLRDQWFAAPDLAAQQKIAVQIQAKAFELAPYLPLGMYIQPTVQRKNLTGTLTGLPVFWNIRRT